MSELKQIKNALISVFYKENLAPVINKLNDLGVGIYSTGGTQKFIEDLGAPVTAVEHLTSYPSILGGRVKTLHPKIFGGILGRRELEGDVVQLEQYDIPEIDLVIVDLYPFEETVASGAGEQDIIEKIDIGGISLIRAAAKNFKDVLIIPSRTEYPALLELLETNNGATTLADRKQMAARAFNISSHYDTAIYNYFDPEGSAFKASEQQATPLRYGENPHQQGTFYGNLQGLFDKLHGKELSYNNLLDVDAAVLLMGEFADARPTMAVLKHNNACGCATRDNLLDAWDAALAGDPVSAFGGIIISNRPLDKATCESVNKLFCEVVIAPDYDAEGLEILKSKKNRILLKQNPVALPSRQFRTALNGVLVQDRDGKTETTADLRTVTDTAPSSDEINDLLFANKLVRAALAGQRLVYAEAWQEFRTSGRTLYNAGRDTWGYWEARGGQYCSQWPPADGWACYDVARDGARVRFIGESGDVTEGRIE